MRDAFARKIDYMRVSITDRCNLRCAYCMPEDVESIGHAQVLRFEELLRLCGIMAGLGIKTIRVTGGEPLVRKGCLDFIRQLKNTKGIENVTLTTNGILLGQYLDELASLGLNGLNISLDALDAAIYHKITGFDVFDEVWASVERAAAMGLKVKINCVPMKNVNESQILPMVALAEKMPVDIRFIELMPTGANDGLAGLSTEDVLGIVKKHYQNLTADDSWHGFGPARYFKDSGMLGSVGFISAISDIFCAGCNRIRLSSDGFLTLCLHQNEGMDLRGMLRGGATDREIAAEVALNIDKKPEKHELGEKVNLQHMSKIGG